MIRVTASFSFRFVVKRTCALRLRGGVRPGRVHDGVAATDRCVRREAQPESACGEDRDQARHGREGDSVGARYVDADLVWWCRGGGSCSRAVSVRVAGTSVGDVDGRTRRRHRCDARQGHTQSSGRPLRTQVQRCTLSVVGPSGSRRCPLVRSTRVVRVESWGLSWVSSWCGMSRLMWWCWAVVGRR